MNAYFYLTLPLVEERSQADYIKYVGKAFVIKGNPSVFNCLTVQFFDNGAVVINGRFNFSDIAWEV